MDLYTLNENFVANENVDDFVSAIWTERFSAVGDVRLVLPASPVNIAKVATGTFLALRGSKEVMLLETQNIEDNLLTVTGLSLLGFLNERMAWFKNPVTDADALIVDYTDDTRTVGQFISHVVDSMVINPVAFTGTWDPANLDWPNEEIPGLALGPIDSSGSPERLTLPTGPLYDGIAQLAEKSGVGLSLYLDFADPDTGYDLRFSTYRGVDRTSTQDINPLIRLSPNLDTLSDLKEIRSLVGYKNVAYVYYQGSISTHLAEPSLPVPEGFARRILVTDAEGEPVGHKETRQSYYTFGGTYSVTVVDPSDVAAFREQNAKDVLANHNYIHAIDGQTSPQNEYKYKRDYNLGDVIELEGITGSLSKARITEYIRSQDKIGEKEYPTISVIS